MTPTCDGQSVSYSALPNLPAGVTLNSQTGVISGKPTVASEETRYSIFCRNEGGPVNTVLKITVIESKMPVWLLVIIVVVVVLVIAGIVVAIVFASRKKAAKGKKGSKKTLPKTAPKVKETTASKKVSV